MLKELFNIRWDKSSINSVIIEECKKHNIKYGYDKYFNLGLKVGGAYRNVFIEHKDRNLYSIKVDI